jgi:antitoxin ParD1/3/4
MEGRTTMNVSLTPELEEFVSSRVSSGLYQSASEVVRDGLRLLQEQEMSRRAQLDRLRGQIDLGLEQARRGELLDGEEVFEELARRVSEPDRLL